ncbi:MAG: Hint domain-containing protein, partial [Mycobacterium sp.]|nr:Hint domain-containing protein [Mycobacterium sp.]
MTKTTLDGSVNPYVVPAGNTVALTDGDFLSLLGTIDLLGTISAAGTNPLANLPAVNVVLASPTVTLAGSGALVLAGVFDTGISGSTAAVQTLVNDATISGTGVINGFSTTLDASNTIYGIGLVNGAAGVIDATGTVAASGNNPSNFVPGQGIYISIANSVLVNSGLMEATGVGGLFIQAATLDQSGGGTIVASGAGVVVQLSGATNGIDIIGGALEATGGGAFQFGSSSTGDTLDGSTSPVTIGASVDITSGVRYLMGTIDNRGTIAIATSSYPASNIFFASPTITLAGGGSVIDPIFTDPAGSLDTLVNVDNTISGWGWIGIANIQDSNYGPFLGNAPIALTNEAKGVIDGNGTIGAALTLYNGGSVLRNDGVLEATGGGGTLDGLTIMDATIDMTGGGTLRADGAGSVVALQTVTVLGGTFAGSGGGVVKFNVGNNTVENASGTLTIAAGGMVEVASDRGYNTTGTLTLLPAVLDNLGTVFDASTLVLASPTATLRGGGTVQITGQLDASAVASLVNVDNTITDNGSGTGIITGTTVALTNEAACVIAGINLATGGTIVNAGLLRNVAVGAGTVTTIDNTGGGQLLASGSAGVVGLTYVDILGGTLAGTGTFAFNVDQLYSRNTNTLDGTVAPVTIEAGATLQNWFSQYYGGFDVEWSAGLMLVGSIDLLGTIQGVDPLYSSESSLYIGNAGVMGGTGTVDSYLSNTGTLLARGGTLTVIGGVSGAGSIAIAGGVFDLTGGTGETVDFRNAPNGGLVLNAATAFTGTLDNLVLGDSIDLGVASGIASATVLGGATLALTLADASTIDLAFTHLQAGDTFQIRPSVAHPVEVIDFTYTGGATAADPTYSATGTGSITVMDNGGTATLADVSGFNLTLDAHTTSGPNGAGTDVVTYHLTDLLNFAGSFDSHGALTGLTLGTYAGTASATPQFTVTRTFQVLNLGSNGAETVGNGAVATLGSLVLAPATSLASEIVVACFAAGTRIATAAGEVAVELLAVGDRVRTAGGELVPVRWLGHRRVACA